MLKYPSKYKIKDTVYEIDTSYVTALECFDIINDHNISDYERSLAVIYKLFGFVPEENIGMFLNACSHFLQCGETAKQQREKKRDIDLRYDMKYIVPSFLSEYNIDLYNNKNIHFHEFLDLLNGVGSRSTISRVRQIRNYNLNEIKDPKTRREMAEIKESVELPIELSKEEQERLDMFNALFE